MGRKHLLKQKKKKKTRGSGCEQPQAGSALNQFNEVLNFNLNDVFYNVLSQYDVFKKIWRLNECIFNFMWASRDDVIIISCQFQSITHLLELYAKIQPSLTCTSKDKSFKKWTFNVTWLVTWCHHNHMMSVFIWDTSLLKYVLSFNPIQHVVQKIWTLKECTFNVMWLITWWLRHQNDVGFHL